MSKFFAVLAAVLFSLTIKAQELKTATAPAFDSAALLKEMMDLLKDIKPVSYVNIEVGLGNRLYSIHNRGLNAKQGNTSLIVYAPAIGYFHKTGFNLSAGANFLNDASKGFTNNQSLITAGYDLPGNKDFIAGISYTHYFVKDSYSPYASPVQHDLYASLIYKKSWISPGLALGYSTGFYNTARRVDTVINNIRRRLYDSAAFNLKAFSVSATLSHQFEWDAIFSKNDGLTFTPTLLLNLGSSNTKISHNTNAINLLNFLNKKGKLPKLTTMAFEAESAGISFNLSYTTGHFSLEPQWYLDYYLPKTASSRFTQVISLTASYSF